jgi:hypothetical protein
LVKPVYISYQSHTATHEVHEGTPMGSLLGWFVAGGASLTAAVLAIPRALWSRWRTRIVDHLDDSLRRHATKFGGRYNEHLLSSLRFIDLKGLATVGFYTPELDEVFVDVTLAYRPPHLISCGVLSQVPAEVKEKRAIEEFLQQVEPRTLAILGGPGSGKTTLLRHTALEICRHHKRLRRPVPILLYLRDHVSTIVSNPKSTFSELINTTLGTCGIAEPPNWFEQQLRSGNCVILLDGLDEVAREADRRHVSNWVEQQTRQYPRNDFVITSRPQGYRSAAITGAAVLQVRSLTEEQIYWFVRGWYVAMEKHSTGNSNDEVNIRAEAASNDLLERLKNAPALHDLTVNPLLLTMIANVHRYRGALPGSRSELYGEICQVMLWRRHEAKNIPLQLSGDKKESLLRGLAFMMMQQRVRDLPRTNILHELSSALRRISTSITAEDILSDVTSNGLLLERENDVYAFAHLTFQEYLASAYIRDKGYVETLVTSVDDIWWRETTLLYASKCDADPIVRACLRSGSTTSLMLAFDCADQGSELAPELRDGLDRILDSTKVLPEHVRARARFLVTRHLRRVLHTAGGSRVCASPISNAIYDLFIIDHPRHWVWSSPSERERPVTGVYGAAAAAFVQWVNDITDGAPGYRLPVPSEVADPAVQQALDNPGRVAVWTTSERRHLPLQLWIPDGLAHPHYLSRAVLHEQVKHDLSRASSVFDKLHLIRSHVIMAALKTAYSREHERLPADLAALEELITVAMLVPSALDSTLGIKEHAFYVRTASRLIGERLGEVPASCLRGAAEHIPLAFTARTASAMADDPAAIVGHMERITTHARELALDRAHNLDLLLNDTCTYLMGRGLHTALRRATRSTPERFADEFTRALLDDAGIAAAATFGPPEILKTNRPSSRHTPGPWAQQMINKLDQTIRRINVTRFAVDSQTATQVRLPALCLAAEMQDKPQADDASSEWMRKLAVSMTLLERRSVGCARTTETIMLATT